MAPSRTRCRARSRERPPLHAFIARYQGALSCCVETLRGRVRFAVRVAPLRAGCSAPFPGNCASHCCVRSAPKVAFATLPSVLGSAAAPRCRDRFASPPRAFADPTCVGSAADFEAFLYRRVRSAAGCCQHAAVVSSMGLWPLRGPGLSRCRQPLGWANRSRGCRPPCGARSHPAPGSNGADSKIDTFAEGVCSGGQSRLESR